MKKLTIHLKKAIHLIPSDGLGGVEQAARSLEPINNLEVKVAFLKGRSLSNNKNIQGISEFANLNSPKFYLNGLKYLLTEKPDILVCSLWRSTIIGIIYNAYRKFLKREEIRFIVFIHSNRFTNIADRIITKTAIKMADEIWCDSNSSKTRVCEIAPLSCNKTRVISFLIRNNSSILTDKVTSRKNNFVYWGRITNVKRVDRAIKLFSQLHKEVPESIFYIFGPDGGELDSLIKLVDKLQLNEYIKFMGPKPPNYYPEEAISAKFFFNTSENEGMAIAVTEAMQLGLVPIVTAVGEIANYCIDGVNSIYYNNDSANKILEVIHNDDIYKELSRNAIEYWTDSSDYNQDFNSNLIRVLKDSFL